ncbi:MAG: HD domain protein [Candidatus Methanofastidiosum methylothiophilum]|uniref:CRISPR system single-strand-specific deoxyribonuclease Cas10/Csm1 (subtype III-A) n=1 Tax=Candidatus Methanofastidiosum methylothiophilum TaxID=1705564 RepID=A0A150IUS0_9EURY|nr:MAG: HD domain protein [Candidatus Methanofastidiosum methylthiophilus]
MNQVRENSINQPSLEEITLGALLHDIGKFAQRAGEEDFKKEEMRPLIQKKDKKTERYTHDHALYTFGIVESIRDALPLKIRYEIVASLAACHHEPSTIFDKMIQLGDIISAGLERKEYADTETSDEKKQFYEIPLSCILDQVDLIGKKSPKRFYNLAPLSPDSIFPTSTTMVGKKEYANLWKLFYNDLLKLRVQEFENYLDALIAIYEHYLWCIPSSTIQEPDISLYDHSITTTAFSACLYKYYMETNGQNIGSFDFNLKEPTFLFISGDVSGIQSYIFDLKTTESNAKLLRARSFEIELLTTQAANLIIKTLNLPKVCILTNAGGQFLILVHNTEEVKTKIRKLRETIERYFLNHFLGELSLNISEPVESSISDLKQEEFPHLLQKIKDSAIASKYKKFNSLLKTKSDHILDKEYNRIQEKDAVCPVCDQRAGEEKKEGILICRTCNRLIKIGEKLPKALAVEAQKDARLGVEDVYLLTESQLKQTKFAYSINKYRIGLGIYHMPYHIPLKDTGEPLTFEELAEQGEGTKKIAMFKADVDNLGAVFSIGMKGHISISRYAALSRTLHYFFSTYLNHFIEKNYPKYIYTVFSGGDDVCIIGPWNKVIDFALSLQQEFQRLVGENPSITLSAGVILAHPNIPVRTIASEAEEALKKSKEADPEMKEKNKITLFETTVTWKEFKKLMDEANKLFYLLDRKKISQAFLYRLLQYHNMNKLITKDHKNISRNILWISHLYYDIARNLKDENNIDYEKNKNYLKEFVHNYIQTLRIPVSYVLYRVRKD